MNSGFTGTRRAAAAVALLAALALGATGVFRGTWAVGGSDSSCYGLMADAFARGRLQPSSALATQAPWPDALLTFAPAGFIPSPTVPGAASPVCAPGFSLLMAPFRLIAGLDGVFLVTPVAAMVLIWSAFVVGRSLAGPIAGAMAAVLIAASPIVLFQAVQPMNDIATAASWMAVMAAATLPVTRRWWVMGAMTGLALVVRPNLAPVAVMVGLWVIVTATTGTRLAATRAFCLAALPGVLIVAGLNWALYGHPMRSGYGSAGDLFSITFLPTNAAHYGRALIETQTPFPLLALLALWSCRRDRRPLVWLALAVCAATAGVYALYRPYDEWWYLRFLLPAVTTSIVLACCVVTAIAARVPGISPRRRDAVSLALTVALTVLLAVAGIRTARERQAFDLQRLESRFRDAGLAVRDHLPAEAVLITVWQSGTVRYHAGREAVLWDSLDPASLDRAVTWLRERGREPFLLLERWEEPLFRQRFAGRSELGDLDWPPRFEIDRLVRIYAPDDRRAYLGGQSIPTQYIWPW